MDRLHEELKQPLVELNAAIDQCADDDDTDSEHSSVADEQMNVLRLRRIPSAVYCDAIEASDTDYETCDSGLSSENGSEVTFAVSSALDSNAVEAGDATVVFDGNDESSDPVSEECSGLLDRSQNTCTQNEMQDRNSLAETSQSAVGDIGECSSLVKPICVKRETGAGELGAAAVPNLFSCSATGFCDIVQPNASAPSIDSAISDDGSGSSIHTDADVCQVDGGTSVHLPKVDSSRSLQSTHSSRKSSPRVKDMPDGSSECPGRVRRSSEGATLQAAGIPSVMTF
jgi:hypothetical protein